MRTRTLPALVAGLALALGACTSGTDEPEPTGDGATSTEDAAAASDGLQGGAGNRGWMCQYVSPAAVELAAGGKAQTPRELVTEDTEDAWVCDVLVGGAGQQEPVIRLGIHLGEEARQTARARAEGAKDVQPGPKHLGVSFISPGLVTGLTLCTAPKATDREDKIPYSLVIESLGETDAKTTEQLEQALTETAKNLDRSLGCSPARAISEDAGQTTAP
jgi:hypothetical protein